jgi:hypothetical protein
MPRGLYQINSNIKEQSRLSLNPVVDCENDFTVVWLPLTVIENKYRCCVVKKSTLSDLV